MSLFGGTPIVLGYVSHQHRDELTSLKGLNCRQSLRAPRPSLVSIMRTLYRIMHVVRGFLSQINEMRLLGVNTDP